MSDKWWLISDEVYRAAVEVLEVAIEEKDERCCIDACNCCFEPLPGCSGWRRDALMQLDTSLHITDAVPEDFQEGEQAQ